MQVTRSIITELSCIKQSCMRIITSLKRDIYIIQNTDNLTKQVRLILENSKRDETEELFAVLRCF